MKFREYLENCREQNSVAICECKGKIGEFEDKIDELVDEIDYLEGDRKFIESLLARNFFADVAETEFWATLIEAGEKGLVTRKRSVKGFELTARVGGGEIAFCLPTYYQSEFGDIIDLPLIEKITGLASVTLRELAEDSDRLREVPELIARADFCVEKFKECSGK
jgi:hypothetical protein